MFKKDTHIKMTKDDYNLVISEKDRIIENLSKKIDELQKNDKYMIDFLYRNDFKNPDDLVIFIKKYKNHKCKCDCTSFKDSEFILNEKNTTKNNESITHSLPITNFIPAYRTLEDDNKIIIKKVINILPPKVDLNNCLYKKYKKEKDDRISKIKNKIILIFKEKILINRIKKFLKKKKKNSTPNVNKRVIKSITKSINKYKQSDIYNSIYKGNRASIDTFSNYYEELIINKKGIKDDDIKLISKLHDKNKSRLMRLMELYYFIKKDDALYNSEYIFNYYTLSILHKKNDNFEVFFKSLKTEIIKDGNNERNEQYSCKNENCDDSDVEEDNYCKYCKKDLKKCKSCNIEFVNDELNVYNCEDCIYNMEMEGFYEDDE